jgi:hypothetical protein
MADEKKTGPNTHRATKRGYAVVEGVGTLVEEGEMVPAGVPVAIDPAHDDDAEHENGWMAPVKKSNRALNAALEEGLDPLKKDVDLTKLAVPALQALAAERGINVEQDGKSLSKAELVAAIKGADDPLR